MQKVDDNIHFVNEPKPLATDDRHPRVSPAATIALPLFRSDAQFRILGELFIAPGTEYTIGELAARTGVPQPTVSREVARLTDARLLARRSEGNRTLVSANPEALIGNELRSMMRKLYGPVQRLRERLAALDGVDRAVIFGSFARRWSGEPGPLPRDVDLLVIGDVAPDAIWGMAAQLSRDLGIEINPVLRTAQEWADDKTGFAENVRNEPQIDVSPTASPADAR